MIELNEKNVMMLTSGLFIILLIFIIIFTDITLFINTIISGTILIIASYSIYRFFEFRKIKSYELHFPNFLRDLAQLQYTGLTLIQSFQAAGKNDYGLLSKEIKKVNDQLSWNIPLEKVLDNFRKRMKKSKIISRSIMIISQANKSGGKIEDIMDSLASNTEEIHNVQREKSALMGQQVTMVYAIFFIFLGISLVLIKFLVPMLQAQTIGVGFGNFGIGASSNPCHPCLDSNDVKCIGCSAIFYISSTFGFGDKTSAETYYKSLFFTMVIIQGFLTGLVAGQIGSDSVIAGVKHSLVMVVVALIVFLGISYTGLL